jgi:hypothetical protein
VMIFFGYLTSLVATAYFIVLGGLIAKHLAGWFEAFLRFLERVQ